MIHRREKGKERFKVPLKLMLHQWVGRAVAILGIVQVALGLTLYGSPKVLFILFAVWSFLLLIAYFVLSFKNQPEMGFDDRGTYITDRTESTRRSSRGHGLGRLAAAGAAGAGLAALRNRSRSRSRSRRRPGGSRHSSRHSESYVDEKYTEDGRRGGTWKNKLFGAAAAAGGIMAVKSLFNRNKNKKQAVTETGSDVSYSRPIGPSEVTQTDLSRLEEGRAPASPANDRWRRVEEQETAQAAAMTGSPLRQNQRPRRSGDSIDSFDSRTSISDERPPKPQESHGLRNGIAALGMAGFAKHLWNRRRNRKEEEHVDAMRRQDMEEERIARANSQRRKYTGDGLPPPRRSNRPPSTIFSESDVSGVTPSLSRTNIPPPPSNIPPPPRSNVNTITTVAPSNLPPPPPPNILGDSGSEAYTSTGGGRHRRHRTGGSSGAAAAAAATAAAVTSTGSPSRRNNSRHRSSGEGSIASPPVSVKVKMHNDGRHVTLRRLKQEEVAAAREARRNQNRRNGSVSSLSNFDNDRWRRTEALEAQQAQQMGQSTGAIPMPEASLPPPPPGPPPAAAHQIPLPPPPPIPAASILSSPAGTNAYGTETDVSNYDSNRRRRRAERAQAKARGGSRVEFS